MAHIAFKNSGLNRAVDQQALGIFPVHAAGALQLALVHEQAVGAGQAGVQTLQVQKPRHQLSRAGGVAIAHQADHWNAPGICGFEQVVGNRLAHRARLANAGLEVHQQTWARIDFNNGATLRG